MERVNPASPLTPIQAVVADLLGFGTSPEHVAEQLRISVAGVRFHVNRIAAKLPGDLPAQMRVIAWARGATLDVLTGMSLKTAIVDRANDRHSQSASLAYLTRQG